MSEIPIHRQLTTMSVRYTKCWMLILLQDAQKVPRIFFPFGAIPAAELQDWLRRTRLVLPSDLIELWQLTGGGDVFETETIFRPTVPSTPNSCFVEDDIEGRNTAYAEEGKSGDLYVFQQGAFLSAVRLSDQRFVTLTEGGHTIKDFFDSLDEWYIRTLRAEYGERYGLPPMVA
jgi:hypothetical protein